MTDTKLVPYPGNEDLTLSLANLLDLEVLAMDVREFPDGESYLRFDADVENCRLIFVCTLDHPNSKALPLFMAAHSAREQGAREVGLVCPYLCYMRQDKRFHSGEVITSRHFAELLSNAFDWLITIDPHLHRIGNLSEIYSIPAFALHGAELLAHWIQTHVHKGLIIGPDMESEQWVSSVAEMADMPFLILEKTRHGDHDVEIEIPDLHRWVSHMPVLVDDIVSSGGTMIETVKHLKAAGLLPPICAVTHGLFAGNSYTDLQSAGVDKIISTNTIPHPSNHILVGPLLSSKIADLLEGHR